MYDKPFHEKDITQNSFLVTGGAGFIGSHIVEYLLKYGAKKVRVLDNLLTGRKENVDLFRSNPNYEFIEGDICNINECRKACEGMDYLLHQAALGSVPRSVKDPVTTNHINCDGFLNMLLAARDAGIKRIVYASSSSVYGDHPGLPKVEEKIGKQLSPYAVSKYSNELYAHVFGLNYGMKIIGLRYFNIFGPRQDPNGQYAAVIPKFIAQLKKGVAPTIHGDGKQTRDFTFVENAVQANIRAILTNNELAYGEVFNIAVGDQHTLLDMFHFLQSILKTNISPVHIERRAGDIPQSQANTAKAERMLGYKPQITFKKGLEMTVDSF